METSLHRQLKEVYAVGAAQTEVPLGDYRIDVVNSDVLIEIQHGSLSAIRDKVRKLLKSHNVLIVKPILIEKRLIKLDKKGGKVVSRRKSPKTGSLLDVFDELIYFTRVYPHPNLCLEVPLVDVDEFRYPGHGRRRRRRKNDFQVQDRVLTKIRETHRFNTAMDLARVVPPGLPKPFHTGHLAEKLGVKRWVAQRIAYCYRHMGTAKVVGKEGNANLYEFGVGKRNAKRRPTKKKARRKAASPTSSKRKRVGT
ncbi:MAG: hypothetical protein AAF497_12620 [Planctomycetota bacterium]